MTSSIHERAKTMWPSILMQLGFPASKPLLDHKSVPCPFCGGRDRFHFSDRDGVGLWHCRGGCGKPGGDGFDLIMAWRRCDFATAAQMVEGVLGKPRLILCVALELKDWAESLGASQPHDEVMRA